MSEFKQFQDMFNSLQEGVLVVKELLTEPLGQLSKGTKHQIYFVNDIGNRILQKVFKTKKYKSNDILINNERVSQFKIFYEYKSA